VTSLPPRRAAEWLFAACGLWLVGLGLYFIFLRPALLPEDLRYMGAEAEALQAAVPGLAAWLGKVFTVMGGFMAGAGVLTVYLARSVLPSRREAAVALGVSGALTLLLMSAVNFALHSDFRWLLALPTAAWAAGVLGCLRPRARARTRS
jgi:hypothetical protein